MYFNFPKRLVRGGVDRKLWYSYSKLKKTSFPTHSLREHPVFSAQVSSFVKLES